MNKKKKYDCVIIGAGLSGLAAGIRLAYYGKKVCICEQHSRAGGLNSFYYRKNFILETGLHAMTNFASVESAKTLPLRKLLRQLRISFEEIKLRPQKYSLIKFPNITLKFSNSFSVFADSVKENFSDEFDNFMRLDDFIRKYDALNLNSKYTSAKDTVADYIENPLLREMLFCPLMYYGSAVENDMDFSQFAIMYKSIFHEGFCRPGRGIKAILSLLENKFVRYGGELRYKAKVDCILCKKGKVKSVLLDNGTCFDTENVLSCAGLPETLSLCDDNTKKDFENNSVYLLGVPGKLGFIELIAITDEYALKDLDFTIMFFNEKKEFVYRNPGKLCDMNSGVICIPSNFDFQSEDIRPVPMIRVTMLADFNSWQELTLSEYKKQKNELTSECLKRIEDIIRVTNIQEKTLFTDFITPCTIKRYTGRLNGAVYGSPYKQKNGKTAVDNLFICGTDQGFLGIVGAMLSGISIVNLYLLR